MPIHSIPTDHHDRILEVARRLGTDLDTCTETIQAIPADGAASGFVPP